MICFKQFPLQILIINGVTFLGHVFFFFFSFFLHVFRLCNKKIKINKTRFDILFFLNIRVLYKLFKKQESH